MHVLWKTNEVVDETFSVNKKIGENEPNTFFHNNCDKICANSR